MSNTRKIIEVIVEFVLIIVSLLGIILSGMGSGFMGKGTGFLYFTIQSNITITCITIPYLISNLLQLLGKKGFFNRIIDVLKYIFTVAITITFLVYACALSPNMPLSYNLSFKNLSVHFIVPILALIDFFVFDNGIIVTKKNCLYGLAMPFYYVLFFLFGIPLNFRYLEGSKAPYFFLNYERFGWFRIDSNGIGVVYWIIIATIFFIGLCYLFYVIQRALKKSK